MKVREAGQAASEVMAFLVRTVAALKPSFWLWFPLVMSVSSWALGSSPAVFSRLNLHKTAMIVEV